MTSTSPTDLSATSVIAQIEAGAYPRETILTVARGFLPLAQEDLIAVHAFLALQPDEEIAAAARDSLAETPARVLVSFASNESAPPEHLVRLTRATRDATVLEALIRNRAVPDSAILDLARIADPPVQEVIVINQLRILRVPEIIDALLENPNPSPETRRRALETREEFFEKKARLQKVQEILADEQIVDDQPLDAIADLLEKAVEQDAEPARREPSGVISATELEDTKKKSVYALIMTMSIAEKVQLAFKGDKTIRGLLLRDRNRLVCTSAIRNPRVNENEVELVAGSRNVEEEVLRIIGHKRDWVAKYPIALALVKNPKAPLGVVLPLINRLTLRDLKSLKDDKGVAEAVRVNARKLFQTRQK